MAGGVRSLLSPWAGGVSAPATIIQGSIRSMFSPWSGGANSLGIPIQAGFPGYMAPWYGGRAGSTGIKNPSGHSGWFRLWLIEAQKQSNAHREVWAGGVSTTAKIATLQGAVKVPVVVQKAAKPRTIPATHSVPYETRPILPRIVDQPSVREQINRLQIPSFSGIVLQSELDQYKKQIVTKKRHREEEHLLLLLLAA